MATDYYRADPRLLVKRSLALTAPLCSFAVLLLTAAQHALARGWIRVGGVVGLAWTVVVWFFIASSFAADGVALRRMLEELRSRRRPAHGSRFSFRGPRLQDVLTLFTQYKVWTLILPLLAVFFAASATDPQILAVTTGVVLVFVRAIGRFSAAALWVWTKVALMGCDRYSRGILEATHKIPEGFDLRTLTPQVFRCWTWTVRIEAVTLVYSVAVVVVTPLITQRTADGLMFGAVVLNVTFFVIYHRFLRLAYDTARKMLKRRWLNG
jgi:hypothetical protein